MMLLKRIKLGLNIFNFPPFKKFFTYIFLDLFGFVKTPFMGIIGVTYFCPAECAHCMVEASGYKRENELDMGDLENILSEFKNMGIQRVLLFGGEPFSRKDILEIIEMADNMDFAVAVDSNGYYIGEPMAKRLSNFKRLEVTISIDSDNESRHDSFRRCKGLFNKACSAVKFLSDNGVKVITSVYVTRDKLFSGELERIVALSRSLGASGVRLMLPVKSGRCGESLPFSPKEIKGIAKRYDPSYVFLSEPYSFLLNRYMVCEAIRGHLIYVDPFGNVGLCPAIPVTFGNIRNMDLKSIWLGMKKKSIFSYNKKGCPLNDKAFEKYIP